MLPQRQLLPRAMVVAAFALSCFAILVFLWQAFGGPVPLKAQGYRVQVDFAEATQLAVQAEVRLSGVPVGRVVALERTPDGLTRATLQLDPDYVPMRVDTKATLRAKSLAGETYVEISPGRPDAPALPDGGTLARANVKPSVQLDEVLQALTPKTRAAFRVWFEQQALAGSGVSRDVNDAFAQLAPLEEQATTLLTTLNASGPELSRLVRDTGEVFSALTVREAETRGLIRSSERVFDTIGARNRQLAATFEALPTFERESRATIASLNAFADRNGEQIEDLQPVARALSDTAIATQALAPTLRDLVRDLGPLQEAGAGGLPAGTEVVEGLGELAKALPGPLNQLNPFLAYVSAYERDLMSFAVNVTAASQAGVNLGDGKGTLRYLRMVTMLTPEQLASYPRRLSSSRTNPYPPPNTTFTLAQPMASYETRQCDGRAWPTLLNGPGVDAKTVDFLSRRFGTTPIAPACIQAPKRGGTSFPQLGPDATPTIP